MKMRYNGNLLHIILISTWISISYGCQMEGVTTWFTPVTATVLDTHSGSFFNRATTNIVGINSITYGDGLNFGPYVQVTYSDSVFDITTNDAYRSYEENETAQSMTFTIVFGCTGGSTAALVFIINVIDTNNNAPQFLPNNQFEFIITPPLPPGYQITGCLQDITVRDIDLTTQRIDFAIEPNEYFDIGYDASLSSDPKEFKAVLRTTTFIRTLSEPVELIISATDVDLTGDPPITTSATIRITPDSEFQFPEEPAFSQAYYMARYEDNQVVLDEPVTLNQGFHDMVQLSLEGDHSSYFELQVDGNQLSFAVTEPLSAELLREGQLILAVRAEREFTSGASATVVIRIPEVLGLRFENTVYEGRIVDDAMEPLQLVLAQGYEGGFSVTLTGDYSSFFTTTTQSNIIILSFSAPPNLIEQSFINIQVLASNEFSTASTVVTLEIIRDDIITPAFEKAIYIGNYTSETGLSLEPISLVRGYDETVSFTLEGEHATYFEVIQNGSKLSVNASSLPAQVLSERNLILSLLAAKPRTVGANAAIYIELPPVLGLRFENTLYEGRIVDDAMEPLQLVLAQGYEGAFSVTLTGDYSSFFTTTTQSNIIILSFSAPPNLIEQSFINIQVLASNEFSTASTVVTLEIIRDDIITPAFEKAIYIGNYTSETGLSLEPISLVRGYDETVSFTLEGEHATYFEVIQNGSKLSVNASSLPEQVLSERNLILSLLAAKPRTVGAKAAIYIELPPVLGLRFENTVYEGRIVDDAMEPLQLVLAQGYEGGFSVTLTGDYSSFFTTTTQSNIIILSFGAPPNLIEQSFINIQVLASNEFSTASTVVTLEIIRDDIITPAFEKAIYIGNYTSETGLSIEPISLVRGYDETVSFTLEGEHATYFEVIQNGSKLSVNASSLPEQVLSERNLILSLLAAKPRTVGAKAAIYIELPPEHATYFEVIQNGSELSVNASSLPAQVLSERNLILSLLAAKPRTVGANAATEKNASKASL